MSTYRHFEARECVKRFWVTATDRFPISVIRKIYIEHMYIVFAICSVGSQNNGQGKA